jgi:hypothetical protein
MSAEIRWEGFDELIAQLTSAPAEIRAEGMTILREETEGCAQEIRNAYAQHSKSGKLERGVGTEFPSTSVLVGIVRSKARHSHLFEFGTKQRRTSSGANRGVMPAVNPAVVVPIARRRRERMLTRLMEMMKRRGFQVTRS